MRLLCSGIFALFLPFRSTEEERFWVLFQVRLSAEENKVFSAYGFIRSRSSFNVAPLHPIMSCMFRVVTGPLPNGEYLQLGIHSLSHHRHVYVAFSAHCAPRDADTRFTFGSHIQLSCSVGLDAVAAQAWPHHQSNIKVVVNCGALELLGCGVRLPVPISCTTSP
jgi:hypothetical protein